VGDSQIDGGSAMSNQMLHDYTEADFYRLIGHKIEQVTTNDLLEIKTETHVFRFRHYQDCCEHVTVEEDGVAELKALEGAVVREAYIGESGCEHDSYDGELTWFFYHVRTDKGDACLRFVGESNGYYSHEVDLEILEVSNGN